MTTEFPDLAPDEHLLAGAWGEERNRATHDDVDRRILWLVTRRLVAVGHAAGGWDQLYRDPRDGQYPERELNPFWMMGKFQEAGLLPELLPAFFSRKIETHPRQWVKDVLRFFCTRWPVLSVYVWPIMRIRGRKVR